MKDIQLKIWPDLCNYSAALVPLGVNSSWFENNVTLDLSNVSCVNSTGVTLTLLNLLKVAKELPNRKWNIIDPVSSEIQNSIKSLGFYEILLQHVDGSTLFSQNSETILTSVAQIRPEKSLCFPIYSLRFTNYTERRKVLTSFKELLFDAFKKIEKEYKVAKNVFITILNEIAKNSADHTSGDAYFGMDYIYQSDQTLKIAFSYGDFGLGICQNIKNFFSTVKSKRAKHMSLYEAYYWALKTGFSTKTSLQNKGIGMSMIYNSAKEINLDLQVFDAESMGKLNRIDAINSHASLRKIFYDVGNKTGFYYYGELVIDNIN